MLPLLPAAAAGAGALFLLKRLGGRVIRRRRQVQDPRTAVTLRMKRVNPKLLMGTLADGSRMSVKRNADTGEWMVVHYFANGKRNEGPTSYHDDKEDAVNTFHHIMKTHGAPTQANPKLPEKLVHALKSWTTPEHYALLAQGNFTHGDISDIYYDLNSLFSEAGMTPAHERSLKKVLVALERATGVRNDHRAQWSNPLRRGHSRATISHNIRELMRSGRGQKQAIAIAFRAAGLSRNPKRMPGAVGTAAARVAQWRWHHNPKGDAAKFRYLAEQPTGVHRYGGATYQTAIRNGRLVYKQLYAPGYPASGWRGIKTIPPRHNPSIVDAIRAGDRVTISTPHGSRLTGRAVMRSSDGGWVLNLGGKHGTPGLAYERNIVKVSPRAQRNPADHMAAANEIKNQIGARALFMLGAKNLAGGVVPKGGKIVAGESIVASPSDLAGSPYLIFKVGRNAKGVTHVVIFLDPSDTYTVQFLAVRGTKTRTVSSQSDVYVDALRPTLEAGTGMATSLGTMRANPRRRNPVHPSDLKRVGDLKPYHFTFRVGKKRIDWVRYGKDMNSTHDLAVLAAKREYANASGFQTTSVNPCRR